MDTIEKNLGWIIEYDLSSLLMGITAIIGAFYVPKSINDRKRTIALEGAMKHMLSRIISSDEEIVWDGDPKTKKALWQGWLSKLGLTSLLSEISCKNYTLEENCKTNSNINLKMVC